MKKTPIFYVTIIVTLLSLQPLLATPVQTTLKTQTNSFSMQVAHKLYKRGLDAEVAKQKAQELFNSQDDDFLDTLQLLQSSLDIGYDAMVEYFADAALKHKKIDMKNYSSLVAMVQRIKNIALTKEELQTIQQITALA